jgi:hypothetical protein
MIQRTNNLVSGLQRTQYGFSLAVHNSNDYSLDVNGKSTTPPFNTLHNRMLSGAGDRRRTGVTLTAELHDAHATEALQPCSTSQHLNAPAVISCSWSQSSAARERERERERERDCAQYSMQFILIYITQNECKKLKKIQIIALRPGT